MIKNVAIKTVYGEFNLGNKLQNYAVVEILKKQNLNPTTVRYTQLKFVKGIKGNIKDLIKRIIAIFPINSKFANKIKIKLDRDEIFVNFSKNYLCLSQNVYNQSNLSQEFIDKFDLVVIGSDQVWNDNDMSDFDLKYYLGVNDIKPCISLSASFGVSKIKEENKAVFKKGIDKMLKVSVREEAGQKIINSISKKYNELLVDPTMVLTKEEWKKIEKKPTWFNNNKKYILCYFLGGISKYRSKIYKYAKKNNLEIIDVLDKESIYYKTGPQELVYLVRNAEAIFTDSFHGCVFSIIFNKDFLCFDRDNQKQAMNSRLLTLLETFNLKNMMFKDEITLNKYDYNQVNSILNVQKTKFENYLQDAIYELNKKIV